MKNDMLHIAHRRLPLSRNDRRLAGGRLPTPDRPVLQVIIDLTPRDTLTSAIEEVRSTEYRELQSDIHSRSYSQRKGFTHMLQERPAGGKGGGLGGLPLPKWKTASKRRILQQYLTLTGKWMGRKDRVNESSVNYVNGRVLW